MASGSVAYCARCLYPSNHPLNIVFDAAGVCSGCRVHEEKDRLDWRERFDALERVAKSYRAGSRSIHDCIIPVSGGRDSHFIVHVVKHVLGLRPLLVTYNKHYNTPTGIRNLAYLRSLTGTDIIQMTVSPQRAQRITRETLRLRGSMYWHCLAGETVFPVQIAVKFKIPLIIWGAHQGLDQVGMFSHLDEVEMTRKYRQEHDLMGLDAESLLVEAEALTDADTEVFRYPHDAELAAVGVRGIYLNNYVRWDTKAQHEAMIDAYGYEPLPQQRTFDTYNDVDSFHYSGIHDVIKFAKYGYGKVTDHASREIRLRRLTRERGIELVSRYARVVPNDLPLFLDWVKISEEDFWRAVDAHRDPRVWGRDDAGRWALRDSVVSHVDGPGVEAARLPCEANQPFHFRSPTSELPVSLGRRYILIGRGWADTVREPTSSCAADGTSTADRRQVGQEP